MREASLASEPGQLESMPTDCDRPPACLPFPKPDYLRFSTDAAALRSIENWETKQGGFLALPRSLSLFLPSLLSSFPCSSSWWLNSDRRPSARPSALRPSDHRLRGASDGRRPPLSPRLRRRPRRPRVHFLGNTAASNWDSKRRKKRLVFRLFFSFGLNLSCLPLSLFRAPPNQEEETNTRPPT